MPCFVCHNLGTFKKYKDIGLTSYRYLRFSTCQNLGVFHKNHFLDSKNPWPTFACQNLGIFEECKDFGPTLWQNSRFNTCRYLGVFLKNQVFDTKTHCLCGLSKSWGFKEYKDIGPTWYPNQSFIPVNFCFLFLFCFVLFCFVLFCFVFWLFHYYVFEAKNSWPIFVFVKILGFSKNGEILGLHCIKISGKRPVKMLSYFIRTMFFDAKNP